MDCSEDRKISNLKDFFIYIYIDFYNMYIYRIQEKKRDKIAALFCTDIDVNI